jgi:hypothetical protein
MNATNVVTISAQAVQNMKDEQDRAAAGFYAYPDADWQVGFQASWLMARFGVSMAQGPDGLIWGE